MSALLAKPGLNQIIAIIQAYQATAIAAVNPSLPTIREFHKGPKYWTTPFPWLTVAYEGTVFEEEAELTRRQRIQYVVALESGQFDSELAQDQAIDYLRVLDYIFTDLAGPPPNYVDWITSLPITQETVPPIPPAVTGMTTPWDVGTVKEIFIEREEQSVVLRQEIEQPIIEVRLEIRVDLEEVP